MYAAEKTAQKSRELIEFKKDRLEVSAITAKTLREPCSRICSVAGAIRSLWLSPVRCRGTLKDSTSWRHPSLPSLCLDCYTKPIRFVQPFSDVLLKLFKYLTAQLRVSALGASSLLDCYNVHRSIPQHRLQNSPESRARYAADPHKHWLKYRLNIQLVMSLQADFHSLPQGGTPLINARARHIDLAE